MLTGCITGCITTYLAPSSTLSSPWTSLICHAIKCHNPLYRSLCVRYYVPGFGLNSTRLIVSHKRSIKCDKMQFNGVGKLKEGLLWSAVILCSMLLEPKCLWCSWYEAREVRFFSGFILFQSSMCLGLDPPPLPHPSSTGLSMWQVLLTSLSELEEHWNAETPISRV